MPIELPFAVRPAKLASITTGNALASRPVSNLGLLSYPSMTWKSSGNLNLWARGSFPSAKEIDFVSMVQANALPGTTIRVRLGTTQAQVDGVSAPYDSTALPFISPAMTREGGLYHSHLAIGAVQSATWWRIDIGGHTGDFEAAGLVMGKRLTPTRFYDRDFEYGFEDLGGLDINRLGIVAETPGITLQTLLFKLAWTTEAEYFEEFRPMLISLATRGVSYWCFDPEPTAFRQDKTFLGFFARMPFAKGGPKPRTFEIEFLIRSLI